MIYDVNDGMLPVELIANLLSVIICCTCETEYDPMEIDWDGCPLCGGMLFDDDVETSLDKYATSMV